MTLAVIAVLIGLLLPSLAGVRETTRQVICRNNVRQLGMGMFMFADDNKDMMPQSIYAMSTNSSLLHLATVVRRPVTPASWDGLGLLYSNEYLPAAGVFYCPSHTGEHPLARYETMWTNNSQASEIISNFQYRGYSLGTRFLTVAQTVRPTPALISDGLRTQDDYSHRVGANFIRADLSVIWFNDRGGNLIAESLPNRDNDSDASEKVISAWERLDSPQSNF